MSGERTTSGSTIRDTAASYGELMLAEHPAIELLQSLCWEHKDLYAKSSAPTARRRGRASIW